MNQSLVSKMEDGNPIPADHLLHVKEQRERPGKENVKNAEKNEIYIPFGSF